MFFHRLAAGVAIFAAGGLALGEEPRPVVVAVARKAPALNTIELPGTITPRRQSNLSTRTAGLIRHLRVDAGHRVKAGEVLMELDNQLAAIVLGRIAAERAQAESRLADAQRLEAEARRLATTGAFAKSEAQSRKTALSVADAELRRVIALEREQGELLERHRLIAPFEGVIRAKHAEEGEWVETGDPVLELVETTGLRMDVQAPQELYPVLTRKPAAKVVLDVYPDRTLDVKSATVVPLKDAVTRTFLVRMEMDDPASLAAPGMSARARFEWLDEDAVQIPRDALIREPGGDTRVWIVTEHDGESKALSREVSIGRRLGESLEIIAGIDEGDRVVVRGNENLTEGRRVVVVPE
ncbi:MAG: efflux RND transporter periplasmic adaptor subunit [Luteolibacter sp.]